MKVFITGATGLIGSATVKELLDNGHEVVGLARSEESAAKLTAMGAQVLLGSITDLDVLQKGATESDGTINLAFSNDFSQFQKSADEERAAIEAIGEVLKNTNKPLVIASGGPTNDEADPFAVNPNAPPNPRQASSDVILKLSKQGVRASIVRMPICTHNDIRCGFITMLIEGARKAGRAEYIGDGSNSWPAAHNLDVATLFRLAIEKAPAGSVWQAVAEEGVTMKDISEAIARHLGIETASITSQEAQPSYGFVTSFLGADLRASSKQTREQSGWQPHHIGLLEDIENGSYFSTVS